RRSHRALRRERPAGGEDLMVTERMRRVNEVLREVLAEGIEALGDPSIGFVTVTTVRTAADLSHADVFVSVLGSEKRRGRSLSAPAAALRSHGKHVRTYLEPESTIPHEVDFLDTSGLERDVDPASLVGWTLLALDCGNERRLGGQQAEIRAACAHVIDVDHH